jgi:hypothetical protein
LRRAGLFRYVNLLTLFAVGVALLFAITAPPHRVAFAANICGEPDGSPDPTFNDSFVLTMDAPASGAPLDEASATANFSGTPPAVTEVRLVWDIGNPQVVALGNQEGGDWLFDFTVPFAEPGPYQLVACYGVDAGEGVTNWFVSDIALFDVTELGECDTTDAIQDPLPQVFLNPDFGPPGSLIEVTASGGESDIEQTPWIQIYWNFGFSDQQLLFQGPHTPDTPIDVPNVIVPNDADPDEDGDVAICYYDPDLGFWWSTNFTDFDVTEAIPPPTSCTSDETDGFLELQYQDGVNPHSGPTGSIQNVVIADEEGGLRFDYYLIWDFEGDDPFVVAGYAGSPTGPTQTVFGFTVPYDAAPGTYDIGLCELFDGEGGFEWIASPDVIQFTVLQYGVCGNNSPSDVPFAEVTLNPNTGPVGTVFQAAIDATDLPVETIPFNDAYLIQVIWDWEEGNADFPATGLILTQVVKNDSSDTYTIPNLTVPNAVAGAHVVNICYYIPFDMDTAGAGVGTATSNDGIWFAGIPDEFNVTSASGGPPTNTPVPPTNTPGVIFGPDQPTPTPTVPPTATVEPTATPPPLGTIAALAPPATPPVSGTQIIPGTGTNGGGGGTTPIGGPGPNGGTNPNTGPTEPAGTPPAGSPTAAPPSPTSTARTGTPTPTPTTSPVPSDREDEVLGSRSEFVRSVPGAKDVSGDMDVLATNIVLTAIVLILIFLTSEIFNQTIRDNQDDIESWLHNFFGPVIGFWAGLSAVMGAATLHNQKLKNLIWLAIVLVITVLIEGFLNPGFGFNKESGILFLSLLVAVGLITYLTEGGEAFIARTLFGQDTAVRVFPLAIGIALLCVVLSRLGEVVPGILYGFVGTAVFLRPSTLNKDQDGQVVFLPMAFMLVLSVICWLLVDSFRGPGASDFDAFIEGILVGIFLGTIEGVAINMIPIAYMDGRKLIDWNPLVWIATAGVAVFLVWEVLLNDQRAYFNSLQETTTSVALIAVGSCFGLSVVTWLWFRYRPGGHA